MVIFTKKLGQFKQWTGEKLGSTWKTEKPAEIKQLQNETRSRFDGINNIRAALNTYMKSLDETRHSSMGELAQAISAQSYYQGENEFGTLLVTFGDGLSKLSDHQNNFANEIRSGLLMSLDDLLNETKEFERLRKKLKNRRLDYDAKNNKLQKSKKEDPALEENVKTTKLKYEETLQKLEEMMITVSRRETELIDPFIGFIESQMSYYQDCLKTSESILQVLKEGKTDLKTIDFVAASFRKELESDGYWSSSQDDSDEELAYKSEEMTKESRKSVPKTENASIKPQNEANPEKFLVKANFNFEAESENELSLKKGDIITVTKRIDEGWWQGSCGGKSGMFPSNYVTVIEDEEDTDEDLNERFDSINIRQNNNTESDGSEEPKTLQSNNKPGFSYLPQGAPITFIGRKGNEMKPQNSAIETNVATSCSQCDCEDFAANVFKPGHCNNCFHKH